MSKLQNIPYGRQDISDDDIAAVTAVLKSDWLTQGPAVPAFESAVAAICNVSHAIAVNSATSALHIACLALDVGPGDLVWTSPNTFVASANCARYCGADVDFVDIDPDTLCLSTEVLATKLAYHRATGKQLPKVLIPVHFGGQSCDMAAIHQLSIDYGFRIIEDASHAIGACYQGEPVGNCRFSDICIFSFHPVKIITSGEGGMAVTNDAALAKRMTLLRSHGITRDEHDMEYASPGPWYYEQLALGLNYRMTDIHAALGLSQLSKLDEFITRRNALARVYDNAFAHLGIGLQSVPTWTGSARHLYVIRVNESQRHTLFANLRENGIGVNMHYSPVYLQPYYRHLGFGPGYCIEAERYAQEAISLPMFATLTDEQRSCVIATVTEFITTSLGKAA
jgi:UDP-4-amino-4,6-dideoxy-N-acetyl-beta-L-altrosamine transaminase